MGVWGTLCEWIVLAATQRIPPAEPVKIQIAARLIVMVGSAPELGFVHRVQKQGNEIVKHTEMGENIPSYRKGWCDSRVIQGLTDVLGGEEVKLNKGLRKLRQVVSYAEGFEDKPLV